MPKYGPVLFKNEYQRRKWGLDFNQRCVLSCLQLEDRSENKGIIGALLLNQPLKQ